tara:strand:+ start:231 stop:644 length:414 start_codon:yes stop_codon:yes gene_type:complete
MKWSYNMEERKDIRFSVRKSDRKKMIQSFLAMAVGNFDAAAREAVVETSKSILENEPKIAMKSIEGYLDTISEYQQALEDIYKLIEEHMFIESKKTHLNFKAGEKMKMTEFNEAINEQTAKDNEEKEKIKQRVEQEE